MAEFDGYEAVLGGGSGGLGSEGGGVGRVGGEGTFCVAFQKAGRAMQWCTAVQEKLLAAKWPPGILSHSAAREEKDGSGEVIYKGLRVRMGISYGSVKGIKDSLSHRTEYIGPSVALGARVCGAATGGQILLAGEMYERVRKKKALTKAGEFSRWGRLPRGEYSEVANELEFVYEYKPATLKARAFGNTYILYETT